MMTMTTVFGGADDHGAELVRRLQPPLGGDGDLKGVVGVVRRRAERAAGDLHVLLAQRAHHIPRRQAERGETVGVEPDPGGELTLAEDQQIADPVQPHQPVALSIRFSEKSSVPG